MAYGFELTNKNGELLFSTEEPYSPLQRVGNYTSTSSDGVTLPTPAAGELVFARPQNGESGVIASSIVSSYESPGGYTTRWKMLGTNTDLVSWGIARGHKRFTAKGMSTQITTPTTSGYGFECYDDNGDVVFSSFASNAITVEAAFELPFGDTVQWANPSGDFDDVYVLLPGVITQDIAGLFSSFTAWGSVPGPLNPATFVGTYAHFNDSTEEITIYANGSSSSMSSTNDFQYDDLMEDNGSSFFFQTVPKQSFVMIVRVNE